MKEILTNLGKNLADKFWEFWYDYIEATFSVRSARDFDLVFERWGKLYAKITRWSVVLVLCLFAFLGTSIAIGGITWILYLLVGWFWTSMIITIILTPLIIFIFGQLFNQTKKLYCLLKRT